MSCWTLEDGMAWANKVPKKKMSGCKPRLPHMPCLVDFLTTRHGLSVSLIIDEITPFHVCPLYRLLLDDANWKLVVMPCSNTNEKGSVDPSHVHVTGRLPSMLEGWCLHNTSFGVNVPVQATGSVTAAELPCST
jgi:hypothetical protein